jgi:hypothetical protein
MFNQIVTFAVNALLSALTPERVRGFIQTGVKAIQDHVRETETKSDDFLIPASNLVLAAIEVPGPDGQIDVSGELGKLFVALGDLKDMFVDAGLDHVEDTVEASENKLDDAVILPLCALVRKVLNVPDNDA